MKNQPAIVMAMLFAFALSYAQELPKLIPSNPEVAAFGKYIDTPVSLSSGVPNISVPLVTLKGRSITVPVSLSYHAGGFRVSEMASRVGLGWNLNAGGAINRSVRGYPDDFGEGYLNPIKTVAQFLAATMTQKINWMLDYPLNDYESDMYTFNFLGQSGKFFFKQDGTVVMHPKGDLKITPVKVGTFIKSWIVTTTDGTKYYFGKSKDGLREANDTSTSASTSQLPSGGWSIPDPSVPMTNYITSWKLMDIETPSSELVSFDYASSSVEFWNLGGQEKEISQYSGTSSNPIRLFYSVNNDKMHRVTSITNSLGTVEFLYDTNSRQDLEFDYALQEVQLKDSNNTLIDAYKLTHGYFISPTTFNNGNTFGDVDQRRKRLYLQNVQQTINATTNKTYSFEYDTSQLLPDRFSYAQDFWGYFNGQSNSYFYPTIQWPVGGTLATISGGDRKVYDNYAKACILKKITYPTGGSTEFEFESNQISNLPFIGLTNMVETTIDQTSSVGLYGETEKIITISNIEDYVGGISWSADIQNACSSANAFDCPKAELYKYDGSQYVLISSTMGVDKTEGIQTPDTGTVQLKIKIYNYSEDGGFGGGGGRNEITTRIFGYSLPPGNNNAILAGGLRVKNIKTRDSDNTLVKQKDYVYTKFNDATTSSGSTLNPPTFVLDNMPFITLGGSIGTLALLKSTSIYPLTNGGSYSTIYQEVTELFDGGNEGKTEHTFTFVHDGMGIISSGIYSYVITNGATTGAPIPAGTQAEDFIYDTPLNDFSHRRSVLKTQKSYKKEGSNFKILQELENNFNIYDAINQNFTKNIKIGFASGQSVGGYTEYHNLSERYYQLNQIRKTYDENGLNPLVQTTTYGYDPTYAGRSFPIQTSVTTSNDAPVISKTYFSGDVTSTSSLGNDALTTAEKVAIDSLTVQHRIAEPIQVSTYRDHNNNGVMDTGELISVQRTNYYEKSGTSLVLPKDVQTLKGDYNSSTNKLQDRLVYHEYYNNGNIKEVSKKEGAHIVYIWGYQQQLPIAKIENASYAEVSSQVASLQTASNNDDDRTFGNSGNEGALRTALNSLRSSLPNALVTTFTYDPQIGVTSVTDPTGQVVYYHYDDFNRLIMVTDKDNKVLSTNEYHYKN